MSPNRFLLIATLMAASAIAAADARAQSVTSVAGRILSVHCEAHLLKNNAQSGSTVIVPRDIALGLAAGDRVQCIGSGYMEVLVWDGIRKIDASKKWVTIPELPSTSANPPADATIAESLKSYGISGATRGQGADSHLQWPAEGSAVLPEHFEIRWKPVAEKISLSIMTESKDSTLWGPSEIDGKSGELKSAAVSAVLAAYRKNSAATGLVLTMTIGTASDWEEVHFSLLGSEQQRELNTQLDYWSKHTEGLALLLGRGYCYSRHKLFAEAADEYESALKSTPGSRYLMESALQADRMAGRASRVKELQSLIAAQSQEPGR